MEETISIKYSDQPKTLNRCEACQSSNLQFWLHKKGYDFWKCRHCGLGFMKTLPSLKSLYETYENYAKGYYLKADKQNIDQSINHDERLHELAPYKKTGRLLDVGCSTGGFLKSAKKAGWVPYGVDFSPTVVDFTRKNNFEVFCGTLDQAAYPDNFFDVVRASATLEHVPDPFSYITEAYRIVRKNGLFHFSVPSIESLLIRILSGKYRYICEGHLYYFSRQSIIQLMKRAGFKKFRAYARGFDIFPFIEDLRGYEPESTAKTALREREYVARTKKRWYYRPIKTAHQLFQKGLELANLGEGWYVYALKE